LPDRPRAAARSAAALCVERRVQELALAYEQAPRKEHPAQLEALGSVPAQSHTPRGERKEIARLQGAESLPIPRGSAYLILGVAPPSPPAFLSLSIKWAEPPHCKLISAIFSQ
jgi:hypothetical protein